MFWYVSCTWKEATVPHGFHGLLGGWPHEYFLDHGSWGVVWGMGLFPFCWSNKHQRTLSYPHAWFLNNMKKSPWKTTIIKTITGWWFGTWILCFHILGMSSSQLTFTPSFFRGVGIPPTRYSWYYDHPMYWCCRMIRSPLYNHYFIMP